MRRQGGSTCLVPNTRRALMASASAYPEPSRCSSSRPALRKPLSSPPADLAGSHEIPARWQEERHSGASNGPRDPRESRPYADPIGVEDRAAAAGRLSGRGAGYGFEPRQARGVERSDRSQAHQQARLRALLRLQAGLLECRGCVSLAHDDRRQAARQRRRSPRVLPCR